MKRILAPAHPAQSLGKDAEQDQPGEKCLRAVTPGTGTSFWVAAVSARQPPPSSSSQPGWLY